MDADDNFRAWSVVICTIKKWKKSMYGIVDCDKYYSNNSLFRIICKRIVHIPSLHDLFGIT